jgi:hypothetical protein
MKVGRAALALTRVILLIGVLGSVGSPSRPIAQNRPTKDQIEAALLTLAATSGAAGACGISDQDDTNYALQFVTHHWPVQEDRKIIGNKMLSATGFGLSIAKDRNFPTVCSKVRTDNSSHIAAAKRLLESAW